MQGTGSMSSLDHRLELLPFAVGDTPGYALTHLSLYTADQMFDLAKVASEIVRRIYLTIGCTAVLGLAALRCGARYWHAGNG